MSAPSGGPWSQVEGSACSGWAWLELSGPSDWSVSDAVRGRREVVNDRSERPLRHIKNKTLTSSFFLGSDSGFLNSGESPYGEYARMLSCCWSMAC